MNRRIVINNILIGIAAFLAAVLVNLATSAIPETWQPYLWIAWPLAVIVTSISIWLSVRQPKLENDQSSESLSGKGIGSISIAAQIGAGGKNINIGQDINQTVVEGNIGTFINNLVRNDSEDTRKLRNRQVMLKQVYDIWVKGVLEHSLYNQLLIDLDMEQRPEAIERPWGMMLEIPEQSSRLLPSGTKIVTIFADLNQSLLILGEPGSGKSTMLLELARDLLAQAAQNVALPMPVLFNLSSWAEKRQPLRQWLVDELREKYQIPKALAQTWVEHDELLLLLDGLDEVKPAYREDCIKALNEFQQSCKALVPVALCSRTAEYTALTSKLKLNGAIVLRPLTVQQIDAFLLRAGDNISAVAHLLQSDVELQTLAQSPLIFSLLCLTYQGKAVADIEPLYGVGTHLQQLFDAYIVRMFRRRGIMIVDLYPDIKTLHWLAWLATQMVQYSQTEFLIERLQPGWLQPIEHERMLTNLLSHNKRLRHFQLKPIERTTPVRFIMFMWGPLYGLIFGFILGLIIWLIQNLFIVLVTGLVTQLVSSLVSWLIEGMIFGLIIGLIGGLSDWLSAGLGRIRSSEQSGKSWKRLRNGMFAGLFWLLIISGLLWGLSLDKLKEMSILGLVGGLVGGLVSGFKPVKLVNRVPRTWKQLRENLVNGLFFGLSLGLSLGLFFGLYVALISGLGLGWVYGPGLGLIGGLGFGLVYGLAFGLISGLSCGLIGGLLFGLFFEPDKSPDRLNIIITQIPNQGVKRVAKLSLVVGLLTGLSLGASSEIFFALNGMLEVGLRFGIIAGLIAGLISGGDIFVKHMILRFALYSKKYIPFNYARFLDYCADRIFLRKVGGGYIFIHRLMMEHFAELTEEDIKRLANSGDGR